MQAFRLAAPALALAAVLSAVFIALGLATAAGAAASASSACTAGSASANQGLAKRAPGIVAATFVEIIAPAIARLRDAHVHQSKRQSLEQLIELGDRALYEAKQQGRNRVQGYSGLG